MLRIALAAVALAQGFAFPPVPTHYVTDNAAALSAPTAGTLENELRGYERTTHHQIIVWIGQSTGDVPLETWTGETASHWKVGRKGYDDGAILFLFLHDHKVRIEVGYGLESKLTDAASYRIIQDVIVPRMRAGDADGAVSRGVAAMLTTITPNYNNMTPPPSEGPSGTGTMGAAAAAIITAVAFLFPLTIIVLVLVLSRKGGRSGSGGGWIGSSSDSGSSSSSFDSGGSDDDFDAGGGDFGGGGASGSW